MFLANISATLFALANRISLVPTAEISLNRQKLICETFYTKVSQFYSASPSFIAFGSFIRLRRVFGKGSVYSGF